MKRISLISLILVGLLSACVSMVVDTAALEETRARYAKAEAMFQERCKKSGVFIYRTAENVEGIFLLKLRPQGMNYRDQYKMDDPYGSDADGEGYLRHFLMAGGEKGLFNFVKFGGYRYVDAIDPKDGKRYRYTGSFKEVTHTSSILMGGDGKTTFKRKDFVLDRTPASDPAPRYGVTYDDISTREERDYWIAGSSLRVIDLQTNEVMAERIGYMMDRGQGNNSGGREPWLMAANDACPMFGPDKLGGPYHHLFQFNQTRNFVEKVLHTNQTRNFVEKVLHTVPEK